MSATVELIKSKLGIVDVVAPYVKLSPAGKNMKGLSPFTSERTPSFFVSPDRDLFYCFSTNKGGDIFTFVQEVEGIDFSGALRLLAEKAQVPLDNLHGDSRDDTAVLYEIMKELVRLYHVNLLKDENAKQYVRDRGISEETVRTWQVGFALQTWRAATSHLLGRGFSENDLIRAGVSQKSNDVLYDRFRNRIMFPITDTAGRPIAFSGRTLEEGGDVAKYINSPETPIFHKSRALFGFHLAKQHMRVKGRGVVVEGQVDLLLTVQSGINEAVAVSGTALTEDHLKLIHRHTDNVVFIFDADSAGRRALLRGAEMAYTLSMNPYVVVIPVGKDPADVAKEDEEQLRTLILNAEPLLNRELKKQNNESDTELYTRIKKEVLPLIKKIASPMDRQAAIRKVSATIGDDVRTIESEIENIKSVPHTNVVSPEKKVEVNDSNKRLFSVVFWLEDNKKNADELITALMEAISTERYHELYAEYLPQRVQLVFEVDQMLEGRNSNEIVQEMIFVARERHVRKRLTDVERKLRIAQKEKNDHAEKDLLSEHMRLSKILHKK